MGPVNVMSCCLTFRVRQFGAPDLATNIGSARHGSCNQPQLCELEDVKKHLESTRCPCGNSVGSNNMIQVHSLFSPCLFAIFDLCFTLGIEILMQYEDLPNGALTPCFCIGT